MSSTPRTPHGIATMLLTRLPPLAVLDTPGLAMVLLNPSPFSPTKLSNPEGKTGQDMRLQVISLLNNKARILSKILTNRCLQHIFKYYNNYQVKFITKMQGRFKIKKYNLDISIYLDIGTQTKSYHSFF